MNGTTLFPDDMCAFNGIPSFNNFLHANILSDLKSTEGGFIYNVMQGKMRPEIMAYINREMFIGSIFLTQNARNVTYQKNLYLLKASAYRWLKNNEMNTMNYSYYETTFPNKLLTMSFGLIGKLYDPVNMLVHDELKALT